MAVHYGGFNPLWFNPQLWLDASDASTLFTTYNGSTLALSGDPVGKWVDKSGLGHTPVMDFNDSRRLTKVDNILNGQAVCRFDGSIQELYWPSNFFTTIGDNTVAMVVKKTDTNVTMALFGNPSVNGVISYHYIDSKYYMGNAGGFGASTTFPLTSFSIIVTQWNQLVPSLTLNGVSKSVTFNSRPTWAGGNIQYLGYSDGIQGTQDLAEFLFFPSCLTPVNRRKVEAYLSKKWAIPVT